MIFAFIHQHSIAIGSVTVYILIAMGNALPDPTEKFQFYPWFYTVVHSLMNKAETAYQPKLPN